MKRILMIICILFTATSWAADEEFPIELTCELGNLIVYYNITENPETTWWQNHNSNTWATKNLGSIIYPINKKKNRAFSPWWQNHNSNKKHKQYHEITDDYFIFRTQEKPNKLSTYWGYSHINRKTGKASLSINFTTSWVYLFTGQCTKGFKNYEKNVF